MKKHTILKVLSVVVLLTFVLAALLTGCNGKLKEDVAQTQTDLATAQTSLDEANAKIAKLQQDLADLKTTVGKSATSAAVDEKVTALNNQIESLQGALAQAQEDLDTLETALATQKTDLETSIGNKEAALQEQIDALEAALGTQQSATETALVTQKADLEGKLAALKAELEGKITDLTADLNGKINTLSAKVEQLADTIDELVAADTFADFKAVTETLADVENEYSYVNFKARCDSIVASAYFEADMKAYTDYVDCLYIRLYRAVNAAEVEAIFADLIAFQESLPTLVQRFEQELLALEGRETKDDEVNGVIDLTEGQLDDLDALRNIILEQMGQDGFEEGQVARYNDIHAAKAALDLAEVEAQGIAREAAEVDDLETEEEEDDLPAIFDIEFDEDEIASLESIEVLFLDKVGARIADVNDLYDALVDYLFNGNEEDQANEEVAALIARVVLLYKEDVENDLTGYAEAKAQKARFATLTAAKDALVEAELDYFPLEDTDEQPLFTDDDEIDADIATIDEILLDEQYGIDKEDENYALVLNAAMAEKAEDEEGYAKVTFEFINTVKAYATRMVEIYNTYVDKEDGNLADAIDAELELGAAEVLYTRIESDLIPLYTAMGKVHTAVAAVNEELEQDIDAANIAAMLGIDSEEEARGINAIGVRVITLLERKGRIDALTDELNRKLGNVTFADGENILTGYQAAIDELFNTEDLTVYEALLAEEAVAGLVDPEGLEPITFAYWTYNDDQEREIVEGTNYENYLAMTEDFSATLADLVDEYNTLKQKVQDIYDEVKDIVKSDDDAVKTLANLQKILWANKKVSALQGVSTPSFVLDDAEEPGGTITFQRFRGMLTARVLQLVALAENADATEVVGEVVDGVALNTAIANLGDYTLNESNYDLNKTAEYKDVLVTVVYWIRDYLNVGIDAYLVNAPEAPEAVEDPGDAPAEPDGESPDEPELQFYPDQEMPYPEGYDTNDEYQEAIAQYLVYISTSTLNPEGYELGEEDPQYQQDLVKFNADMEAYAEFVTQQAAWNGQWAEYNAACEEYEAAVDDYNDYLDALAEYKAAYNAHVRNTMDEYLLDLLEDVKDYFQTTTTVDDDGNLNGADGYILGIGNYNYPDEGNYEFIANFEAVIAAAEDYLETYALAQAEWDEILDDIDDLPAIEDIRIHDDKIADAYTRYTNYQTAYYGGEIENAQFDELTTYSEDLLPKYEELNDKIEKAETLYGKIINRAIALKAISVPAEANVNDLLEEVAKLRADIEYYRENYCDGSEEACTGIINGVEVPDQCKFIDAENDINAELIGYQMQAKLMIVKVIMDGVYYEEIDYLDHTYHINEEKDRKTLKTIFCESIDMKTTIEYVIGDYELFFGLMVDPALIPTPEEPEEPEEPEVTYERNAEAPKPENYEFGEEDVYYQADLETYNNDMDAWDDYDEAYRLYELDYELYTFAQEQTLLYAYTYLYPIEGYLVS